MAQADDGCQASDFLLQQIFHGCRNLVIAYPVGVFIAAFIVGFNADMDPTKEEMDSFKEIGNILDWVGLPDTPAQESQISWRKAFLNSMGADEKMHWRGLGAMPKATFDEVVSKVKVADVTALPIVQSQSNLWLWDRDWV